MTTTVTINAHCDPESTQVIVRVNDSENRLEEKILQDGESFETHAYDDREIVIREVAKTEESEVS